ncbi:hypothetical protein FB567DRAFT_94963 [Paraphoma chrysanthemicola]|uniref:Uncharacterized protein n=1 Tax=Paraphoma chrysanthemicola TaxID=798071 RepID=A0A8K0VWN1_9PLEO|nr:hypothetical protein FB567DRAFT_94963 [Paraphoma chrysanthemicola]
MLHSSAKAPCQGLAVPVVGGCRPGRGCRSLSGKTLGWKMANDHGAPSPTPDRAWVSMGQQLGLPAARATRQEVLGAAKVEPFTVERRADWPAVCPARKHVVAQEDRFASSLVHSLRNLCANHSPTPSAPDLAMKCWRRVDTGLRCASAPSPSTSPAHRPTPSLGLSIMRDRLGLAIAVSPAFFH